MRSFRALVLLNSFVTVVASIACATGTNDDLSSPPTIDASLDTFGAIDATAGDGARVDSSSDTTRDTSAVPDAKDTSVAPIDSSDPCPGRKLCAGKCYDLTSDPDHCGGCDQVCPDRANAARTCKTSTCGFTCNSGYDDCNENPLDGCEAKLDALDHCGACTTTCASGPTTDPTCGAGTCGATCKSGLVSTGGFCSSAAGVFATNLGCSGCGNANSYTGGCSCPAGYSPTGSFVARTDACGVTGSTIQFCDSGGPAVGVWGGAYQADDAVSCGLSCRSANPKTGGCSCPAGYTTQLARVLITNGCGTKIGSRIALCVHPTAALDDFGGAYQIDDAVPGGTGCRMANTRTGGCSCPSGFGAAAIRTLVDVTAGEIGGQLFTCWR